MSQQKTILEKVYNPQVIEPEIYALWEQSGAFRSAPNGRPHEETFTIVIPPPNVTGALHLGHALNNTLQDILIRYHRMRGFNTLWQPGTDHAGIATQAVVERLIREQEGKNRQELGREELVQRIWHWKEKYEARIISQLKAMGCSCDWERNRFTLDEGLSVAVRHMFFKLFKDGLIFRGKRLVNWDTQLQTAVSDDEVYYESVQGHFWYIEYPVLEPQPGEPQFVMIATTRPETMLGDTAVAVHPDPERFFEQQEAALKSEMEKAGKKDRTILQSRWEALTERRSTQLPTLITLRDMARAGRKVLLPLVDRPIPLICDEWADPTKGAGCVKITPAHDPNDYEVGLRHNLPMINVLTPDGKIARIVESDGTVNPNSAEYEGLHFSTDGRNKVVADLESRGLLDYVEDHEVEIGHSDRSKLPIEPYLSDQWFIRTGDLVGTKARRHEGTKESHNGIQLPNGEFVTGLSQAAMHAVQSGRIQVFPQRYAKSYLDWLAEKRDWCISRQLWWGHRIPVWTATLHPRSLDERRGARAIMERIHERVTDLQSALDELGIIAACPHEMRVVTSSDIHTMCYILTLSKQARRQLSDIQSGMSRARDVALFEPDDYLVDQITDGDPRYDTCRRIRSMLSTLNEDEDVLDTWFSSALWPFSTLGWPEETQHLKQYYPTTVLCTSRDIITNWVARVVMFGLYALGEVPFDHVYIHPKILDGRGETMSKSKGNGVDPMDVIHTHGADALRYSLADMTTETQDIRMPVEYVCPHCGSLLDQGAALQQEEQARKSRGEKLDRKLQPADCTRVRCASKDCGREFATQWADEETQRSLGIGCETSEKFDIGRNFCNKLWNAARFAFIHLENTPCERRDMAALPPEDRWILAGLSQTVRAYHQCIHDYQFSASIKVLRDFFWDALCDWYIELTKPRLTSETDSDDPVTGPDRITTTGGAKQVLAFCLDQVLRLWHPTIPFITEQLWRHLNALVARRGFPGIVEPPCDGPLVTAAFPPLEGYPPFDDATILKVFGEIQDTVRAVRDLRSRCNVSPKQAVTATVVLPEAECAAFHEHAHIVRHMANVAELTVDPRATRPVNAGSVAIGTLRVFVHGISDDQAERERATKQLASVEKQISGKQTKLANEKFVAHAKPEVVEAERRRLADLLAQQAALKAHLSELRKE